MCSERSGSNLITRMMDAHPSVCGPTPSHLVRVVAEHVHRYGDLRDDASWRRLLDDAVDLLDTKLGRWATSWDADSLADAVCVRDAAVLARCVLENEARAHDASTLFLKENHSYRYLPFLERAFPGARFVAMVRDPRDMALSWKRSPILRGDVVRAAGIWRDDQQGLLRARAWLGDDRMHVLRYEDLVSDAQGEIDRLCAYLDLEPDAAMLTFHDSDANDAAAARTDDWKNLASPLMTTNFDKWRRGLDADEIAYVDSVCGDLMPTFGYDPETRDAGGTAELLERLAPRERHEKPAYADVPASERALRRARTDVLARIAATKPAPLLFPTPAGVTGR